MLVVGMFQEGISQLRNVTNISIISSMVSGCVVSIVMIATIVSIAIVHAASWWWMW